MNLIPPPQKQIVTMFLEPILDPFSKSYYEVITLSNKPNGPLSSFVRLLSFPKLSEFKSYDCHNQCSFVILKSIQSHSSHFHSNSYCCKYSGIEDISEVLSFLVSNGYVIEHDLTKITSKFNHSRKVICVFSYSE
jgi:hypothetical protein